MKKRQCWLDSVIVSAMMSESRIFTVRKFPDWTRLFWILWLFIPVLVAAIISTLLTLQADFMAGVQFLFGLIPRGDWRSLVLPVGVATG